MDLTFGTFLDIGLADNSKKKLEWIDKVLSSSRPERVSAAELGAAVNEQEIARER